MKSNDGAPNTAGVACFAIATCPNNCFSRVYSSGLKTFAVKTARRMKGPTPSDRTCRSHRVHFVRLHKLPGYGSSVNCWLTSSNRQNSGLIRTVLGVSLMSELCVRAFDQFRNRHPVGLCSVPMHPINDARFPNVEQSWASLWCSSKCGAERPAPL